MAREFATGKKSHVSSVSTNSGNGSNGGWPDLTANVNLVKTGRRSNDRCAWCGKPGHMMFNCYTMREWREKFWVQHPEARPAGPSSSGPSKPRQTEGSSSNQGRFRKRGKSRWDEKKSGSSFAPSKKQRVTSVETEESRQGEDGEAEWMAYSGNA